MTILNNEQLVHIEQTMDACGYTLCGFIPEIENDDFYIAIDYRCNADDARIYSAYWKCGTEKRAKVATRSLLNKANVYDVVVFTKKRVPVTFYSAGGAGFERLWNHYYTA